MDMLAYENKEHKLFVVENISGKMIEGLFMWGKADRPTLPPGDTWKQIGSPKPDETSEYGEFPKMCMTWMFNTRQEASWAAHLWARHVGLTACYLPAVDHRRTTAEWPTYEEAKNLARLQAGDFTPAECKILIERLSDRLEHSPSSLRAALTAVPVSWVDLYKSTHDTAGAEDETTSGPTPGM